MGFKFVQLTGPQKTLILTSHYGPMGRPRQGAVVREKAKLRESEVYYFGNPEPSRFIASEKWEPWEIKGRFSDYWGGAGFALKKKDEVLSFFLDKQPVRITWDDIVNVNGIITEFDPGLESDGEVEWQMTVKIDRNNFQSVSNVIPDKKKPMDHINQILLASTDFDKLTALPLNGSIFDTLDSLVSVVASATAAANQIATSMQDFESSTIATLRRFRNALGQLKTAGINFRNALDSFEVDLAIERNNADDRLNFLSLQSSVSSSALSMIRTTAEADRDTLLAERGQIRAFYVATGGDTWERISVKFYNTASRAGDIRTANSIPSGQPPEVNAIYQIPK